MYMCIGHVLDSEALASVATAIEGAAFEDGALTAGWAAQGVKHNRQLAAGSPALADIQRQVQAALQASELFTSAALPRAVSPVMVSQTLPGMGYGNHIDNALMGVPPIRTDLAFTLFLSPPESYDGGELVIDDAQGEQAWKLAPGQMLLYPATTLHRVQPVTRGLRNVAVGWVQCLVRDPRIREMLFDLDAVRRALFTQGGQRNEFNLLQKTYANLLRLHAEP